MKGFTLFSGIEGVGCGMKAAGIEHVGGIEYDPAIAQVARDNGFDVTIGDVLTAVPDDFPNMDLLHVSTSCKSGSSGNASSTGETENDIQLGKQVALWIHAKRPSFFTLENVWLHRTYEAFQHILNALAANGYFYHFEHVNMAEFGVPQSRQRLILRASRVGLLRPLIGHERAGWDSVIASPGTKSQLTKAQSKAVEGLPHPLLIDTQNVHPNKYTPFTIRLAGQPAMTVVASGHGRIKLVNGSVTALTVEHVAALQTFPAWYELPENNRLAQTGIGNAVPPLFYQRVTESLQ